MRGEKELQKLLSALSPVLKEGAYVFCTQQGPPHALKAQARMVFEEYEGTTLILERSLAHGLLHEGVFACIRLDVHSSLEAVGLTATVSTALAYQDISANVVAGYYHDYIFVPYEKKEAALGCLKQLYM
ncbi:ACT domain-containing protein [Sulfurospirillum sp. T05]|uniref:ACT domain-containing protein n=1 Tax=Sulfurospirillum tamanense TaxID=2813362 RepID=A0ABS2WNZ1_9BACT|nr:ACT domain-containing protein [Sulfurospirillum tamanensis]MBN2963352.1 ACT domain-containing protein [Sulfurospirillum tamanensis]